MSNVIDFLEKMGRDAQLRHASNSDLVQALAAEGLEPNVLHALLRKDVHQVETLLGGKANVCCVLGAVEEGDDGAGPLVRQSLNDAAHFGN
jgi:hypothetical protein